MCAQVDTSPGRTAAEFGLVIYGVGNAGASRQQYQGFKAAVGGKIGMASAFMQRDYASAYRFSFSGENEQLQWLTQLKKCGLQNSIENAVQITNWTKDGNKIQRQQAKKDLDAAATLWAENMMRGTASGNF